jgi:radical SAM protein with 4Fe4S-binding SPASM domain
LPRRRTHSRLRRLLHPLYRRLERKVHPLRYLFVEVTRRCNLACLHCGSDCSKEALAHELSTKEWMRLFELVAGSFDRRGLMLVLTGGEPLCHPALWEIAAGLRRHDLAWGMVTNGYAVNEKTVSRLVKEGMRSVTVSVDGLAATHDWLRGRKGSYDRAMRAVRLFAGSKVPAFDVVTCVHPRNLAELPQVMQALRAAGVRQWRLFNIFPRGRARAVSKLLLSDGQVHELFAWLARIRKELAGSDFAADFCCEGYLPPAVDRAVRDEPYFCRSGICIASVLCDGSVTGCPNLPAELVQGNVRRDDLRTLWENAFQPFRERGWMRTGECVQCAHWKRCQGNSMHLWDERVERTARCYRRILG